MTVRVHNFSVSLDGFGAGEDQSIAAPLGRGADALHSWIFETRFGRAMIGADGGTTGLDHVLASRTGAGVGAEIMGRGKFGPQQGPWPDADDGWHGWWGEDPPFHTPVYVLTHHPRPSLEMAGGTVFHFVDAAPRQALDLALAAAGDLDVQIGGGASTLRAFLAEGLVDDLHVVQVPIVLGRGSRLWDGLEGLEERYALETVASPSGVTHLLFTRRRAGV